MIGGLKDLRVGDLVFCPIGGAVGKLIVGPGQLLLAPWRSLLTWKTWWEIRHVAMVLEAATPNRGPMIGQAMPRGFEIVELGADRWREDHVFIRPRYLADRESEATLATSRGATLAARELSDARVGYGFAAYPRLAAHRTGVPSPLLDGWVSRVDQRGVPREAICSQAVDWALTRAGGLDGKGHVFDDGRRPFDVVPSELYLRLLTLNPLAVVRPSKAAISRRTMQPLLADNANRPFAQWTSRDIERFQIIHTGLL